MSAVYELLRFGRVINTANETLTPADTPFWQQVNNRGATRWVNLNAANIRKFSDADFVQWKQWKLIDDDSSPDSHCDSATIRAWLDPEGKGLTPTSAMARLNAPDVAAKLKRSIFKFPTEWDASTVEARWGWRRTQTAENPTPMTVAGHRGGGTKSWGRVSVPAFSRFERLTH